MPYRLAIFDFDGTLADSFSWFVEASNRAADRFGYRRVEPHEMDELRGHAPPYVMRHVGMPMWKLPLVVRFIRREMARDLDRISLFPGVLPMLEGLSERGVALAIVTSNAEENVRRVLGPRHAALVRHYGCGATMFGKRSKLRAVLAEAGVRPEEALSIGDEIRDLHASRAERIPFGAVTWGFTLPGALAAHAPDLLFTRVDEIVTKVS